MKRIYFILLMLMMGVMAHAQLAVTEFRMLETDMDARVNYPKKDQNGRNCAIIKVENVNKGFQFDTGTLQVIDRVEKPGETWVYVQKGVRKITISHSTLGILRDYIFPCPIEEATTYLLKLSSGKVTTIVEQKSQVAYLIINSQPEGANLFIDGEFKGQTPFRERRTLGESLEYRIQKKLYHDEIGRVEVNQTQTTLNSTLRPAFGVLKVNSQPSGAQVFVDDEPSGNTPLTLSTVASGRHTIRLLQNLYSPYMQEVQIEDGQTASIDARLSARFATLTITAPEGATIKVDGQQAGIGRATMQHGEGPCEVEVAKTNHHTERRQINIVAGEDQSVNIDLLPITGTLIVDSDPFGADIFIDGKAYGQTPNVIEKMLVGDYDVTLRKAGHADFVGRAAVAEGKETELRGTLSNGREITITSTTPGDKIYVDGQMVGQSPLTTTLSFARHTLYAMNGNGKRGGEKEIDVTTTSAAEVRLSIAFENMTFTVNGVSFTMVAVEGGTFTMGATSEQVGDAWDREKPAHQVTLSSYLIGQTEVTQTLWEAVMGSNPSYFNGDNLPVESVSWNDCQGFITKLNALTGQTFSLPTEAEWEFAARGGNKSRGYKYNGSDKLKDVAWYVDNSKKKTHSVGKKQANELGLYDMSGNVWEWCQDRYGIYNSSAQPNPTGPSTGSLRVNRGGSWSGNASYCRVSYRNSYTPDYSDYYLGFRLSLHVHDTQSSGRTITITSTTPGDKIYIDGQMVGQSPLTTTLSFARHTLYAMNGNGKRGAEKEIDVTTTSAGEVRLSVSDNMTFTVNGVTFTMVPVEGGTFTMGATSEQKKDAYDDEKPTHQVTLSSYLIGQTEVTQALWAAVMGSNPSYRKGDNLPVEKVSWNDCQEFITKLNALTGQTFSLPTEAEWEFAARGGNKSRGYKYSGSNNIGDVAWCDGNSGSQTHAVGTKQANELGLYDMSGNVWEWCQDWKGSYSSSAQTNPTGASSGSGRVFRGGSWFSVAGICRVSLRDYDTPDYGSYNLGFRLSLHVH